MISTEMLIVMLVFLVYIGVWYTYIGNFMGAVEDAMEKLESSAYADELAHKVNVLCANSGTLKMEFKNAAVVWGSGKEIYVNGEMRNVECEVEYRRISRNTTSAKIMKENEIVVIE